jgi:hypothetical protein
VPTITNASVLVMSSRFDFESTKREANISTDTFSEGTTPALIVSMHERAVDMLWGVLDMQVRLHAMMGAQFKHLLFSHACSQHHAPEYMTVTHPAG